MGTKKVFSTIIFAIVLGCGIPIFVAPSAWCATQPAVEPPNSHSPTFPKALFDEIEVYLKKQGKAATSPNPQTEPMLRQILAIFSRIDRQFYTSGVSSIPEQIHQLDSLAKNLPVAHDLELDDIQRSIRRRTDLLEAVCGAFGSHVSVSEKGDFVVSLLPKTFEDYRNLSQKTDEMIAFFDAQDDGQTAAAWKIFLETETLLVLLKACTEKPIGKETTALLPEQRTFSISELSNIVIGRLRESDFSRKQLSFLRSSEIYSWLEEIEKWSDDTVHPLQMLAVVERYEASRRNSENLAAAELAFRLCVSKSPEFRRLGEVVRTLYGNSNIKFYVSKALLNYLLPARDPEFDRFQEFVAGQAVVGERRTDTLVKLRLNPDPDKLSMTLQIAGKVNATGNSQKRSAHVQSQTYANFLCTKKLEWTENGIDLSPMDVQVNNRTYLRSVKTGLDGLPLFSGLVKEIARNQFESKEDQINAETHEKVTRMVRSRVGKEINSRFALFNDVYRDQFLLPMENAGLYLEQKDSSTTKDWLLSSWRLLSDCSLGSHTPEPDSVPGSFADIKVHETAVQTVLQGLELGGKVMSVGELKQRIAAKTGRAENADLLDGNDDVLLGFAEKDPVLIRFHDGRIEIILTMSGIRVNRSTWRDFRFIVNYRPGIDAEGKAVLVRDPSINVIGKLDIKTQIALRTVLAKTFPPDRTFSLVPKLFETDERFRELTTGSCRLENGWFAIAIVKKEADGKTAVYNPSAQH